MNSKKLKIYHEEVKERHTTHWDLDYLSMQELKALYKKSPKQPNRFSIWKNRVHGKILRNGIILVVLSLVLLLSISSLMFF